MVDGWVDRSWNGDRLAGGGLQALRRAVAILDGQADRSARRAREQASGVCRLANDGRMDDRKGKGHAIGLTGAWVCRYSDGRVDGLNGLTGGRADKPMCMKAVGRVGRPAGGQASGRSSKRAVRRASGQAARRQRITISNQGQVISALGRGSVPADLDPGTV